MQNMKSRLFGLGTALVVLYPESVSADPVTVVVGNDPFPYGWSEGACFRPITGVREGDKLEFSFNGHDVHKMSSHEDMQNCDFTTAILLAKDGDPPFVYTVTDQDAMDGAIYFACSIGAHCANLQRLEVTVDQFFDELSSSREIPTSSFLLVGNDEDCWLYQSGVEKNEDFMLNNAMQSECTDPELGDDGRYHASCLSGPATLTPGGVINSARILHYPYPRDRRVVVGQRTWEFVSGDPIPGSGGQGVKPVPVNQLYIHHLSGRVVLGQGTEGVRRSTPDAPFAEPYAALTGDEGDMMIFHIIDLRNVTDWLECVECRCRDEDGSYLDFGGGETGGVDCCTNCTDLDGPTTDYRMRYNVSYSEVPEHEPVTPVLMLTADIAPVVGKRIEFDVPSYMFLDESHQSATDDRVQRLEREAPFNEMFKHGFFGADYHGPDEVHLLRCVAHLHIAAIGMWLEDATTGEKLCTGMGTYGTDPAEDKGFLIKVDVDEYSDDPRVFQADTPVRMITEYNATTLHTGVMGQWFIFIADDQEVTSEDAGLIVDVCSAESCDASLLPPAPDAEDVIEECEDALGASPACTFGGMCDCAEFVSAEESTGCDGVFSSEWGDVEVNSMCAKYCGACPGGTTGTTTPCEDTLPDHPACKFGNVCDCEALVTAPESTGCGGKYTNPMGDIEIDEVCAGYCDACPEVVPDELVEEKIVEWLEMDLEDHCEYATSECRALLSNLYSCADGQPSSETVDPRVENAVSKHGKKIALKHARLGHESLHRDAKDTVVLPCGTEPDPETKLPIETPSEQEPAGRSSAHSTNTGMIGMIITGTITVLVTAL